jgi:Domain of unknown function (DUF4440)
MDVANEHSADGRQVPSSEGSSPPNGAGAELMIIGHEPAQAGGARPTGRTEAIPNAGRGFLQSTSRLWARAPVMAIAAALAAAVIGLVGLLVVAAVTDSEWKRCPSQDRGPVETQELHTLATAEFQAFVGADSSKLDHILAPDFTLITPAGDTWSRQKLLMSIRSGGLDIRTFQPRSTIEVRLDCEAAVLTYRSEIDVTYGSLHYRHAARHVDLYERRDGQWLKVWAQMTAMGGFPPPGQ